jgi:hypothetical protein
MRDSKVVRIGDERRTDRAARVFSVTADIPGQWSTIQAERLAEKGGDATPGQISFARVVGKIDRYQSYPSRRHGPINPF